MKRTRPMIAVFGLFLFALAAQADWTTAKRLTWTAGASSVPALAIDSTNALHVVWYDETPGNHEIYYMRSTGGGMNWSPTKRLTWTDSDSFSPDIAVDSTDTIHVVWYDGLDNARRRSITKEARMEAQPGACLQG